MIFEGYSKHDGLGLAELVRRREVSPEDLVDSAIDAIERVNPALNCVVQNLRDHGMREIKAGLPHGPFRGVPFLVKEFGMHFKGMVTAAGSRLAKGVRFDADTELMSRCKRAGLVTVGTTTTPEMAFNASSEAVVYGPTRNPWNVDHAVGGSSGGAGAAVAAGMVPIAHANDGGGSIRIPAACNRRVAVRRPVPMPEFFCGGSRSSSRSLVRYATRPRCSTHWPAPTTAISILPSPRVAAFWPRR